MSQTVPARPVVCVDFDGVLAAWESGTFYRPGRPIDGAREFLSKLSTFATVVIHTCRTNRELYDDQDVGELVDIVHEWLTRWGMADYVARIYIGQGKPCAAAYIDDRAVHCDPEEEGQQAFQQALVEAHALCRR